MMMVSRPPGGAVPNDRRDSSIRPAPNSIAAQCNCGYWHGAFGGIYLPHLRNAVYNHLIAADNLLDRAARQVRRRGSKAAAERFEFRRSPGSFAEPTTNSSPCLPRPAAGKCTSWTSARSATTCWPRWPAAPKPIIKRCWPASIKATTTWPASTTAWCSSRQVSTSACNTTKGSARAWWTISTTTTRRLADVADGRAMQRGDFSAGVYEARLRRSQDRVQAVFSRQGNAWGYPLRITKAVSLDAGSLDAEASTTCWKICRKRRCTSPSN